MSADTPKSDGRLKEKSVRGAALTLSSQGVSLLVQLGSAAILGRLLTPADYGTVAMVTAFTALARIFVDLGLSAAVIQKQDVTQQQSSNLFWLNVGLGLAVTLLVALVAPLIGRFYGRPELVAVTLVLSSSFLISSLSAQQMARLTRDMRFGVLTAVNVSALLVGFGLSVWAALAGFRYWAIVVGNLSTIAWTTVAVWFAAGWLPGLPRRGAGTLHMVRFGSWVTGFNFVNYFSRNLDNVMIGRVWGSVELGFYSRAYSLLMLPISNLRGPLDKVAFPALSRLQDDPQKYRNYVKKYCASLAFLSMPVVGVLFASADDLITLILGPQWREAGHLFAILAAGALIQPVAGVRGLLLMSRGDGRRYFLWGLANAIATVTAFAIGLPWGASGVAIAYSISAYVILHPSLVFATSETPVRSSDFYSAVAKPTLATVLGCLTVWLLRAHLPAMEGILAIAVNSTLFAAVYLAVFSIFPTGRFELKANLDLIRTLFGMKARVPSVSGRA
ncbi:oligosaccharide flippase family protein [bacterium]|nr:oligosaccharide flippase family protein [bacterium]